MSLNLAKGQRVSLEKAAGGAVPARVGIGVGWDPLPRKGFFGLGKSNALDLDASCLLLDNAGALFDVVWFRQLRSRDGSVVHSGDNRTGEGSGDDETVLVELEAVPVGVKSLVFLVNNFSGADFSRVNNLACRLFDPDNGIEIARFEVPARGSHNACVMTRLYRHDADWRVEAIGAPARGQTFLDLMPDLKPYV